MKYMRYPKTNLKLANEIKIACDDYWAKNSSEEDLREAFFIWKDRILKEDGEINITIKRIIGKKRISVLEFMIT